MTHACSDSPVSSQTKSNNDSIGQTSELKFTDSYKPPVEKWTLATDNSRSSPVARANAAAAAAAAAEENVFEEESDDVSPLVYSTSPTYRRISPSHHHRNQHQQHSGRHRKVTPVPKDIDPAARKGLKSSRFEDVKEGEEIRYYGYTNPSLQSNSFKLLQEKLDKGEG